MNDIYIHYGSKEFDRGKFKPIKNISYFSKPSGGLWASDINAKFGWKDWNEESRVKECEESNSFKFKLADSAKVLLILNVDSVELLPQQPECPREFNEWQSYYPDWEKIVEQGYDAVEFVLSNDGRLYFALYGWDCDSILVLNPDVIVPVK